MEIGKILKYERTVRKMTQEDIAKMLNVAKNTYNQYENNKRQPPIEYLCVLADFYKTSLDYLVGRYKQ